MLADKSIIIVSEGKKEMRKLAHRLFNVVGSLDGFDAAIWEEKHFKGNEATLPASQPVIFVGETDVSKLMLDSIDWQFDEFNMRIGWLGKRAVIHVARKDLSLEEYDVFKGNFQDQEKKIKEGGFFDGLKKLDQRITTADRKLKWAGLLLLPYVWPVAAYALVKGKINSNKILSQQYAYVMNTFIADHLPEFLGGSE